MKKVFFASVLLISTFILQGCTTEDLVGSMSANIDGTTWNASAPGGTVQQGRLVITGIGNNRNISVTIDGQAVGTYTIGIQSSNAILYTPDVNTPQTSYVSISGVISITSIANNRVTGTFNAVTQGTGGQVQLTNGTFSNIIYL